MIKMTGCVRCCFDYIKPKLVPSPEKYQRWCTLVGTNLMMMPTGLSFYWGNMSTYYLSFVHSYLHPGPGPLAPWIMPIWMASYYLGIFIAGHLPTFIGKRWTLIIGIATQNLGILGAYFMLDRSIILFNVCMGILNGLGAGTVTVMSNQIGIEWVRTRPGIFQGVLCGSMVIGAIFVNHFTSIYVNPNNENPTKVIDDSFRYFCQSHIIDKLPSLLLILSGVSCITQLLGSILVREKPSQSTPNSYGSVDTDPQPTAENTNVELHVFGEPGVNSREVLIASSLKPREVLRTKTFYTLFFTFAAAQIHYIVVNNFYKAFSQTWIDNDQFLTFLGDVLMGLSFLMSLLTGVLLDRYETKCCLIAYFSTVPLATLAFYFSPLVNEWLFCLVAVTLGAITSPLYVLYSFCVVEAFGKEYFSSNFGLVSVSSVAMNLAIPTTFEIVLRNFGWFYIFILATVFDIAALIGIVFTF